MFLDKLLSHSAFNAFCSERNFDLSSLIVINANNVCNYMDNKSLFLDSSFPNIAPVSKLIWMEWTVLNREEGLVNAGIFIDSIDLSDPIIKSKQFGNIDISKEDCFLNRPARWSCRIYSFRSIGINDPDGPGFSIENGQINYEVKDDGKQLKWPGDVRFKIGGLRRDANNKEELCRELVGAYALVPFMTLSFMHCKNVGYVKTVPNEKLQRRRIRDGKVPLVTYKTLKIDPIKKIIASANNGNSDLTPKSLHICRGHFKNFDDKPLFGKLKGTYWWPMHTRGSVEQGEIKKDYSIKI